VVAAGLLVAPVSLAASLTGDRFDVEVSEASDIIPTTSKSGIAGSASNPDVCVEVGVQGEFKVEWLDADTFELEWFSEPNVPQTISSALTVLDFMEGSAPVDITGVTKVYATPGFDGDKNVSVAANYITIEYPFPAALPLLASGLGIMGLVAARHRRKSV